MSVMQDQLMVQHMTWSWKHYCPN